VTISKFDKSLLIEQIRHIETQHPLHCNNEGELSDLSAHQNFHELLWQRAKCLVRQHDLSAALSHAARLFHTIKTVTLIVVALLGAMATVYAVTDSDANSNNINIYWLLLVLLCFNFISMLLWLIGISLNRDGLTTGLFARLTRWLPGTSDSKMNSGKPDKVNISGLADRAWLSCFYSATVGKWLFSKIAHQLWLVYLFAGLLCLVLLLMVRQYDFIWGTTLLSDSVFIKLTESLSTPLALIGFMTPSADQVQESRLGLGHVLTAEHRSHWAQFLLGSLLCFGILPRLLLLLWCSLMSINARRQFTIDLYLPYYIGLRQRLMPLARHSQIVDADTSPPVLAAIDEQVPVSHSLPEHTKWVAVELGDNFSWPVSSITALNNLGHVIDRESLASTLKRLQTSQCQVLAVAVSAVRSPDRGIQRSITGLASNCSQRWLVLLQLPDEATVSSKRLAAWYRLAQASHIPADHVICLSVDQR
jgi:hypothetical protein